VNFGRNVTLRGTVIIVANEGQRIDIPDGCILENRLLSGNLNMIVRSQHVLRRVVYSTLLFRICDCYCRSGYSRAKHVSQNSTRYILLTYPFFHMLVSLV